MSASVFDEDRESFLAGGADDFVRKPIEEEQLFDSIQRLLGIEYLYELQPDTEPTEKPDLSTCRKALSSLPVELTEQMRQTVPEGDLDQLRTLLDQVRIHDVQLLKSLHILIDGFELETLQTIFSQRR
jgi:DNA-binding response OmpR family regulator